MKVFKFSLIFLALISTDAIAIGKNYKLVLKGEVKKSSPTHLKMSEFKKLESISFDIYDPYTANKKVKFKGVKLDHFYSLYASKKAKSVDVIALNHYIVNITPSEAKKEKMVLVYEHNGSPIRIDKMGPVRIVKMDKGIIDSDKLNYEGIKWVWQVKTFDFKK